MDTHPPDSDLIYDWNRAGGAVFPKRGKVELDDETLRDGLQSPSVRSPSIEQKIEILHLMEALGIDSADIGLPGAGPHVVATVTRLAQEIAGSKMKIRANCAARTVAADIIPIIEISQKTGIPIEVSCFIGSSPIRQYAEDWDFERMLRLSEDAVSLAVREGLPVMYVTEDTTRAHPDHIRAMYSTAIRAGAKRVCVCDTVGHATPERRPQPDRLRQRRRGRDRPGGPRRLARAPGPRPRRDERALGAGGGVRTACTPAPSASASASGNTPMDQLLVNLQLLGWIDRDLTALHDYAAAVSRATGVPIPDNYPIVGRDAFRTGTGVHAAAIIKARRKGDEWLSDRVYSGVPASMVGRHQVIEVGPMSGVSNVECWLESRGIEARPELVDAVFRRAKESDRVLCDEEILEVVHRLAPAGAATS
jgi:2-isopropylmalate synthase